MAAFSRGKRMLSASIMPSKPKKSRTRGLSPLEEAEWYIKAGLDKEGVIVKFISKEIGSGVFAASNIAKGNFIAEYTGERIHVEVGQYRDTHLYSRERHSYLYYFKHQERDICIDGSREYGRIGRMANDSICPNARMKKLVIGGMPYLALFAVKDICPGQEIVYDYGVENLPWRINESTDSETDYDSDPFDLMDQDSGQSSPETSDQPSPQEQSGQLLPPAQSVQRSPPEQSGQLSPPAQSGQLSPPVQSGQPSPQEQSGQLSPPAQSGQLSSQEQSGQLSPLGQSGQQSFPPEQSSLLSPPEQSVQLSPPEQSGQLSPPEQSGQLSPPEKSVQLPTPAQSHQLSPPEQCGKLSPPEQLGQLSPPEQSDQLSPPEQSGQLSRPAQSGQLSPPVQSGQPSPQEQSGQLSPPVQSGQLSSQEQSGQLSPLGQSGQQSFPPEQSSLLSPPEQSVQLSPPAQSHQLSPPEQLGQLSSPEQSGQLSPPEKSVQLPTPAQSHQLSPPEQLGQLSSPEQSGQLSPPEQSGQLSPPEKSVQLPTPAQSHQLSPPEQCGKLSPPEQLGQLSPPEQSDQLSPPEKSVQLSPPEKSVQLPPPEKSVQLSPPAQSHKLSPPEKSGQLSPLEKSGQLPPPEQSGQMSPPEQSGQLSPPEKSGQLLPPEQLGQLSPPEKSGQLSPPEQPSQWSPPEQSGQLSPPEKSVQLSPPEKSVQLPPPAQSRQLSPPEQSGQMSPPEQLGQLSPPEQLGQLSPLEKSGQLSPPEKSFQPLPPKQSELSLPVECQGTVTEEELDVVENSCDSDVFGYAGNNDVQVCDEQFAVAHPEYCGEIDFHLLAAGRNPIPRLCKKRTTYVMGDGSEVEEVGEETGSEFEMESDPNQQSEEDSLSDMADIPVDDIGDKPSQHRNNQNLVSVTKHDVPVVDDSGSSALTKALPKHTEEGLMVGSQTKSNQRPQRFCIYCKALIAGGKLKRHIMRKHKTEADVKAALTSPKALQEKFFEAKRLDGMYEYNLQLLAKSEPNDCEKELMRERRSKTEDILKMCSGCNRFFSCRTFYRHRLACNAVSGEPMKMALLGRKELHRDQQFVNDILGRFRSTDAGKLCQEDELILQVGYRHYCLRRYETSKKDEVRKCVMSEMRELARLFLTFKSLCHESAVSVTTEDMFSRKHLSVLREAIEKMSESESGEKHGLKLYINAVIQRTIKSLKGLYTETLQDDKFEEVNKFQVAYNFRSAEMFSSARYQCISASVNKARKPQALPEDSQLKTLKSYIITRIRNIMDNFNVNLHYVELRSLVVCRLTLYNGRRGEEPARMLCSEWQEAISGNWLPPDKVKNIDDDAENFLSGQFLLGYLHGKGKKDVPILIPKDLVEPVNILLAHRQDAGVMESNIFLFASTVKSSSNHCSGWHAVRDICKAAGVKVNANSNRHRISTIYASLDMSESDRQIYLDHMGHEANISKENYQCPAGHRELRVMGKLLSDIDNGVSGTSYSNVQPPHVEDLSGTASMSGVSGTSHSRRARPPRVKNLPGTASMSGEMSQDSDSEGLPDDTVVTVRPSASATVLWNKEETAALLIHFDYFFKSSLLSGSNNKGKLPSKDEILSFLKKNMPDCLSHLSLQDAYKKTRTKLFNERKNRRENAKKRLTKL